MADAWLALDDVDRARFAPMFMSFNPCDMNSISHVRRMYYKYPRMWRGIGEVMCRHDDLTTMLQDPETPQINHPAMFAVYDFCIEVNLPISVHHNSDKTGDNDCEWEYVHEVEEVLSKYPTLKLIWCHAGVSRGVFEPNHHAMLDRLMSTYDNFCIDISWVVWEDVITFKDEETGILIPKPEWVAMIEKHNTKVCIGSDNVAQFYATVGNKTTNILAPNITKYYELFQSAHP